MNKNILRTLGAGLLGAVLAAPLGAAGKTITIKGSDTMVIMAQRWAEEYMKKHPGVVIQVTGGGSGTGIAALQNGGTDIAEASRPMTDGERAVVKKNSGKEVAEIPVALDGLAIYVHASNKLPKITLAQAKDIYQGTKADWSALGQPAGPIVAYGRENNSGTYAYFKEHVLTKEDFAPEVLSLPGTAAVINAVSKDKNAIGYGGIAYSKGVRAVKVAADDKAQPVEPTMANVVSGKYPISRSLFFYTAGQPEGELKAFVDWALSPEGQKICEEVGYYPLAKKKAPARKKS
jgi:phosphate transport system substrate-binding protein